MDDSESQSQNETQGTQINTGNSLKQAYRSMREHINDNQANYVDPKNDWLEKTLKNTDALIKTSKKASDAVSGSQLLLQLARLEKERIKNLHCEFRSFNNIEFMDKVRSFMVHKSKRHVREDDEADEDSDKYALTKENINHFGKFVMPYFRIPPRPTFLLGSLDKETITTQRKPRKPREVDANAKEKKTEIKEIGKTELEKDTAGTKTEGEIERVYTWLRKYCKKTKAPVGFYEFIVNPQSFSRTIENMFYLSFLVKDGYAKIFLNDKGLPVVEPILDAQNGNQNQQSEEKIQSMISMSKTDWQELIEAFNITTAIIPDAPGQKA